MNIRVVVAAVLGLGLVLGVVAGGWYVLRERAPAVCEIDARPIHHNMHTLIKVDGKRLHSCCARCGLTLAAQAHLQVEILEVTDYVSGRPLPADQAVYVEGSRVEVCSATRLRVDESRTPYARLFDRCAPSLLAFAREDQARAFLAENGGSLKRLEELMREAAALPGPAGDRRHD